MHGLSITLVALFCSRFAICALTVIQNNSINEKTAEERSTKEFDSLHPGTECTKYTMSSRDTSNIRFSYEKSYGIVHFWKLQYHEFEFQITEAFNYQSEKMEFLFEYCSNQFPYSTTSLKLTSQGLKEELNIMIFRVKY